MVENATKDKRPPSYDALLREAQRTQAGYQETAQRLCAAALWHVKRLQELMALPQAALLRQDFLVARLKAVHGSQGVEARFAEAAACEDEQHAQRLYLAVAAEMEELVIAIDNAKEYQARLNDALQLVQGAYALLADEPGEGPVQGEQAHQPEADGTMQQVAETTHPHPKNLSQNLSGCLERLATAHEVQQPGLLDEAYAMLAALSRGEALQPH